MPLPSQPAMALRELMRVTGGSADLVAETLGASRRSVYNWLKGKPVRDEFAARATRVQHLLRPLREEWHPDALSAWLEKGDPSPAKLAAAERWLELQQLIATALRPLSPMPEPPASDEPQAWSAEAMTSALEEFRRPMRPIERREWEPRELTGVSPEPEE
jgi:AcrR family transcriptional regulator